MGYFGSAMANPLVFVAAKRTPFGAFGGSFKGMTATDLAVEASSAALRQLGSSGESIDQIIFGNVMQSSADAAYLARHVGLRTGCPQKVPAVTVNRLCGSGFEAVIQGARLILTGESETVLVGGTESMSQAPYVLRGARFGYRLGNSELEDSLMSGLTDSFAKLPMAMTAENLAVKYGITREECDAFALQSQLKTNEAVNAGRLKAEIEPILLKVKGTEQRIEKDEHPRPDSSAEGLTKLKPVFKKDGVVTAGNASGMVDGAAALVLCSEAKALAMNWPILGKLKAHYVVGCDPTIMGIGPVPAVKGLLARAKTELSKVDLVEVNEAFAAQALSVVKELALDPKKLNTDGGAIAIGHPLGASGARICAHLLYALKARGGGTAIGTACIGGGQGIAVLLEV